MRKVDPFLSFFILESYLLKQKKSRERFVCSGKMYTVILKLGSLKFGEQFLMLDDMWPRNNQWESVLLGKKYFS